MDTFYVLYAPIALICCFDPHEYKSLLLVLFLFLILPKFYCFCLLTFFGYLKSRWIACTVQRKNLNMENLLARRNMYQEGSKSERLVVTFLLNEWWCDACMCTFNLSCMWALLDRSFVITIWCCCCLCLFGSLFSLFSIIFQHSILSTRHLYPKIYVQILIEVYIVLITQAINYCKMPHQPTVDEKSVLDILFFWVKVTSVW